MAVTPIVMCLSNSGLPTAKRVAKILGAPLHGRVERVADADVYFDHALDHARTLFAAGTPIVGVCAAGILVRAVAPLLSDKRAEPPVVAIPDDGSTVIPLLGGHRGANRLARDIAAGLKTHVAVTTAGDVALGIALDEPPVGWRLANPDAAKSVMATLLSGEKPQIIGDNIWDLDGDDNGRVKLIASERSVVTDEDTLAYHPQKYTLGLGCARGCDVDEMWDLVMASLNKAGIAKETIAAVGSLDLKGDEPAMIETAARLGVPFRLFSASELEAQSAKLANPSDVVFNEVGCHGVSEGAAIALCDGALMLEKQKTANATCAIASNGELITEFAGRSRGKLSIISTGPGQHSWRTPEASHLVLEAEELVGYGLYIDLLGPLAHGKTRSDFPLGGEEDRCRYALEQAGKGKNVALICSGDAGIYAMGALVFELLDRGPDQMGVSDAARRVEVQCTPGVSALQGAAARAGAPLGHDFCAISLSDLLTPREDIIKRLNAAAMGDFVIAFYNPVSMRRRTLLTEARDILLQHRPAETPVMLASSLGRPEEHIRYRKLSELEVDEVDMLTVVLIGSSHSKLANLGEGQRMYTPRGYARKIDGDLS
ncbi:precorrin-3B C(17)-methyltransferase [Amylibacter ulvae]|uniref:Precorrin-3B C(17)-methyltransferase n=1 Tax=Paramylibacter ulvae TaxID=1651968 RepID=A0ABQ3D3W8_9RHOB|nr:precorrin-3B C(17)-methyltransferase [Amylibacter ulvae]GHA56250.1 precorrin-3B C(17)-methyltransferase [Amylibacter ulvae]